MPGSGASRGVAARRLARQAACALATLVEAAQGGEEASTWEVRLHAPGRGGRWYAVHAVVTEPRTPPPSEAVVVRRAVENADARPSDPARREASHAGRALADYGFSPRERDVLARVARGQATKEIAAALGISGYTVQDYVRRACEKAGVRTRRELVARVYVDTPGALVGAPRPAG